MAGAAPPDIRLWSHAFEDSYADSEREQLIVGRDLLKTYAKEAS